MADDLQSVILDCAKLLGYTSLKEKQNEAICAFIEGCDIFVSLPTGYGKSLIYAILPLVFDKIRGKGMEICCFSYHNSELCSLKVHAEVLYCASVP